MARVEGQAMFEVGSQVKIRKSSRSPLAGESGRVADIDRRDPYGPYLVLFDNGLSFRYRETEVTLLHDPDLVKPR